MSGVTALVLAHQGGWDELLFVLVPISVFAGLLALANKRATQTRPSATTTTPTPAPTT